MTGVLWGGVWGLERDISQRNGMWAAKDAATSRQADVGDKTKSQVTKSLFMIHSVWSGDILLMGTLASGSQTSVLQKNHSIIASFNHFIRIYETGTSQRARGNGECNDKNKDADTNTDDPCS